MKIILMVLAVCGLFGSAHGAETLGENANSTVNDAKRTVKKGVNRTKEAFCAKGDVQCMKAKAGHRMDEGTDYVKDKSKEVKDKVD